MSGDSSKAESPVGALVGLGSTPSVALSGAPAVTLVGHVLGRRAARELPAGSDGTSHQ